MAHLQRLFLVAFAASSAANRAPTSPGLKNLTVTPGGDSHLSCVDPQHGNPSTFLWVRLDQESEPCLYFYRGNISVKSFQDPSYRGRVKLKDPKMKDGDMSLILKNVTTNDSGTYECRGIMTNSSRRTDTPEPISTVNLIVSGHTPPKMLEGGDKERSRKKGGGKGNESLKEQPVRVVTVSAWFFAIVAGTAIVSVFVYAIIVMTIRHCSPAAD